MKYTCEHCNKNCKAADTVSAYTCYDHRKRTFSSTDTVLGIEVCQICNIPTALREVQLAVSTLFENKSVFNSEKSNPIANH